MVGPVGRGIGLGLGLGVGVRLGIGLGELVGCCDWVNELVACGDARLARGVVSKVDVGVAGAPQMPAPAAEQAVNSAHNKVI
jgi:hypothetical protein